MSMVPTVEEILAWPAPNYVDPETKQSLVLGVQIPLMVLVVVFVSMRFYSRIFLVRALGLDDFFMLAAAIVAVATSLLMCISTDANIQTGYHIWDLKPQDISKPLESAILAMATQLLFVPITALTKVSILLTYLKIFPSNSNKHFCYTMLAFTTMWSFAAFLWALFQCKPIESFWTVSQFPTRHCVDLRILYYTTGGLNILSDFMIFLWPAKDLSKVRISLKQRVTLIVMFCIGIIICAAGVCRLWFTSVYLRSYDALYNGAILYTIVAIETNLGIICGCLPSTKPIMSKLVPRLFASTHSSTHRSKNTYKVDGQSFPFQSLSGGIVKSAQYSVEYDSNIPVAHGGQRAATQVTVARGPHGGEIVSVDSQEWIMQTVVDSQRPAGQIIKNNV